MPGDLFEQEYMSMSSPSRRRWAAAAAGTVALLTTAVTPAFSQHADTRSRATHDDTARQVYARMTSATSTSRDVRLDLLAINDFHGNLDKIPATSSSGRINNTPAGGVEYLARHLDNLRSQAAANGANTITVAAGDLIGASPLLSAAFHDEPTIEAMNDIGLQIASVGNHEFDEGYKELLRMQNGGCIDDGPNGQNNQNSCPDHTFQGANFQYLASNVKYAAGQPNAGKTIFPAYKIQKVKGIKVGFIGMTLKDTPTIVTKSGVEGLEFTDEVETANALVPTLQKQGVKAIVVLLHQGVVPSDPTAYDGCTGVSGPALAIAQNLSPQIDAVISGHTHQPYNCTVQDPAGQPRLLTSASSFGRMITDVHLLLDPKTQDVVRPAAYAQNKIVTNTDVQPVPALTDLVNLYKGLVSDIANAVIGHIAPSGTPNQVISRAADTNGGDSPLGNLIADAQKLDASVIPPGGSAPVIGFMNPGGIRADLIEDGSGNVTYGAAFTVQPFNNYDVSMDLTGQQILDLLEQQWDGGNAAPNNKILQVSGISYTWDASNAADNSARAVVPGSVMVDADRDPNTPMVPLDPSATYRVVCNSFLSDGGDNFGVFAGGQNKYFGGLDIDALSTYLTAHDPYVPTTTDRITQQP